MTYGRTWLLAEAIEAYIRQDYLGPSELIVVNDFTDMTITVDCEQYGDRIKIINLPKRMPSLNDKFDLGVEVAQYPLIAMWDDDDICLPHRLSQSVDAWQQLGEPGYISLSHHYNYSQGRQPQIVARGVHGSDMFTRDTYVALDGSQGSGHNDQNFVTKAKEDGIFAIFDNSSAPCYVYRWGGITGHQSCYGGSVESSMQRFHLDVVRDPRFLTGKIMIVPAWSQDYVSLCESSENG